MMPLLCASSWVCAGFACEVPGDVASPNNLLHFPTHWVAAGDTTMPFVVNTNFDQRYQTGWITRVDAGALLAALERGDTGLSALTHTLNVPSLAGHMVVNQQGTRAFLSHRGDGMVTCFDIGAQAFSSSHLSCGDPHDKTGLSPFERVTDCDRAHLVDVRQLMASSLGVLDDPDVRLYNNPMGLALVPEVEGTEALWVGFMEAPRLAVLTDRGPGQGLALSATVPLPATGIFRMQSIDGPTVLAGTHTGQLPPSASPLPGCLFAIDPQKSLRRDVVLSEQGASALMDSGVTTFDLSAQMAVPQRGKMPLHITGIVADPRQADRLFLTTQYPDAVVVAEMKTPPTSTVQQDGSIAISQGPPTLKVLDTFALANSQLLALRYISRPSGDVLVGIATRQNMLYFFDPSAPNLQLVHRMSLDSAKGPVDLMDVTVDGRHLLLITSFYDHGLGVVDISSYGFDDFYVVGYVHDMGQPASARTR